MSIAGSPSWSYSQKSKHLTFISCQPGSRKQISQQVFPNHHFSKLLKNEGFSPTGPLTVDQLLWPLFCLIQRHSSLNSEPLLCSDFYPTPLVLSWFVAPPSNPTCEWQLTPAPRVASSKGSLCSTTDWLFITQPLTHGLWRDYSVPYQPIRISRTYSLSTSQTFLT